MLGGSGCSREASAPVLAAGQRRRRPARRAAAAGWRWWRQATAPSRSRGARPPPPRPWPCPSWLRVMAPEDAEVEETGGEAQDLGLDVRDLDVSAVLLALRLKLGHGRHRAPAQARPWPPPRPDLDPERPSTPRCALLAAESHGSGRRPAVFGSGHRCHLYSCPRAGRLCCGASGWRRSSGWMPTGGGGWRRRRRRRCGREERRRAGGEGEIGRASCRERVSR